MGSEMCIRDSFGSERTGAPVVAFCRIDERPIRSHDPVDHPHLVVLQDPTLLRAGGILDGLADEGVVIVNSSRTPTELAGAGLRLRTGQRLVTVPATELSRDLLGRPLPNTALLGAVAAVAGVVSLDAVRGAIRQRFASRSEDVVAANVQLAEEAHALAIVEEEHSHAQTD